ncbi:MAG: efflux transporter outer membrane subunit [Candidatus Omnitrophica bacterium]|nr:efflux transporter outer membrane subunit [Candidatus Omnitrophota bacterium]
MFSLVRVILLIQISLVFAGCAVGPDFHGAVLPKAQSFISGPELSTTASSRVKMGEAQKFVNSGDVPYEWWTVFKSSELDALIRRAFADNPTLAAAEATLREARENVNASIGSNIYPDVSLNVNASRQKVSPVSAGLPGKGRIFDLQNASVVVSYGLDIFGGSRREIEALKARVDYEKFQRDAAYLTISGNIITTVFSEAAWRAQIRATEEIVAAQEKQLAIVEQQLALGGVSRPEVLSLRAQLETTRSTLPLYAKELSRTRHQLTTFLGRLPEESAALPEFSLDSFSLPVELPLSVPSELARQRPDIKAAEALLHASCAGVGVATANLYPQVTLSGSFSPQASQFSRMFKRENLVWDVAAGLTQPIFNGGSLHAKKRGAVAVFDQANAHFRETVILAFQNVADVLKALESDALILKAQADAEAASRDALTIARAQLQAGAGNLVLVLNAERQYQQSRIGLIQAQAARLADTAALYQALGGGWKSH